MAVAFRQPTFQNPLPKAWKVLTAFIATVFARMLDTFESIGYARAATQLANMGMYKEAKELMLYRDKIKK